MENPKLKWMITGGIPISGNQQFFGIRQDERSQEGDLGLLRFGVADMILMTWWPFSKRAVRYELNFTQKNRWCFVRPCVSTNHTKQANFRRFRFKRIPAEFRCTEQLSVIQHLPSTEQDHPDLPKRLPKLKTAVFHTVTQPSQTSASLFWRSSRLAALSRALASPITWLF